MEKSLSSTTTSLEAARRSLRNCRSVAPQAASGMLLTSPMVRQLRPRRSTAGPGRKVSRRSGMALSVSELLGRDQRTSAPRLGGGERLIEIRDDVVDMLDADGEPDHFRPHAGFLLLLCRHLPVRGRGRMAGERFGIAHVDQTLEQLERVVKRLAGFEPTDDAESEQRTSPAVEIFLRQCVIGIVGEAGIVDPGDTRIRAQELGDAAPIVDMALD